MPPLPASLVVSAAQIRSRIAAMAQAIAADHAGQPLHLVCVLKGAFVFAADLLRELPGDVTLDFVTVSSYQGGTRPAGDARLLGDLALPIEGRAVVLVEDIVDTGSTLAFLIDHLKARLPASLRVAALLSKPSRRRAAVPLDYVGFEIADRFVVGYGLDHAERYRNLPDIFALHPEPLPLPLPLPPPLPPRSEPG